MEAGTGGVILSMVPGKSDAVLRGGLLVPIFGLFEFLEHLKLALETFALVTVTSFSPNNTITHANFTLLV